MSYDENRISDLIDGGLYNQNLISDAIQELQRKLLEKLDELIVKGLKIKGFTFENRIDLEKFIETNCEMADCPELKERTYYVNKIPFLLHKYEIYPEIDNKNPCEISANYGHYSFL